MIRLFDICLSLIGLIIFFPIIFLICILGWFDTGSPFFIQKRVGLNKKPFFLIKFRTMKINTSSVGTHLVDESKITLLGRVLRKTKIDELPQLWNVVVGEMSLVGPRPCLFNQKKLIAERNKHGIFKQLPGITGLSQLKNINMSTPVLLAKTDLKMINKINLRNYFIYIFITILLPFSIKFLLK